MYHRMYAHIGWTTRGRRPLIDAGIARLLRRFLWTVAEEESAEILELGAVSTHVHVLLRLHPRVDLSRLLQRWKGGSARLINRDLAGAVGRVGERTRFAWAKGYSITTVSPRHVEDARRYVASQAERHPGEAIDAGG